MYLNLNILTYKGGMYASSIFSQRHALWPRNGVLRCLTIFNGRKGINITMKTLREMMDLIESAQTVAEGTSLNDEIKQLFKPVVLQIVKWAQAEGISADDLAGTSAHYTIDALDDDIQDRIDHLPDQYFNRLMDKANAKAVEILRKQTTKEEGIAEDGGLQEYTVRVVDEENSGYTVKVQASSEQQALHKAIVKVRNQYDAYPEHARIIRQNVEEQLEETSDDAIEKVESLFRK